MKQLIVGFAGLMLLCSLRLPAQDAAAYQQLKKEVVAKYQFKTAGKFESFGRGVKAALNTDKKILALTFDACGGLDRNGYDDELIRFLRQEKIPATLFLSGLWIDAHRELTRELSQDTLFEIENHGLTHRPCSVSGASRYGVKGTGSVAEVVDEIFLNAEKIRQITNRKPLFFRSATATTDEVSGEIVNELKETIVNYDLLPGDAVKGTSAKVMKDVLVNKAHNGAIVLMHMNHPERNGREALMEAIPLLRKKGYTFVRLQGQVLMEKR